MHSLHDLVTRHAGDTLAYGIITEVLPDNQYRVKWTHNPDSLGSVINGDDLTVIAYHASLGAI